MDGVGMEALIAFYIMVRGCCGGPRINFQRYRRMVSVYSLVGPFIFMTKRV